VQRTRSSALPAAPSNLTSACSSSGPGSALFTPYPWAGAHDSSRTVVPSQVAMAVPPGAENVLRTPAAVAAGAVAAVGVGVGSRVPDVALGVAPSPPPSGPADDEAFAAASSRGN
jgi:hypothetical protein